MKDQITLQAALAQAAILHEYLRETGSSRLDIQFLFNQVDALRSLIEALERTLTTQARTSPAA